MPNIVCSDSRPLWNQMILQNFTVDVVRYVIEKPAAAAPQTQFFIGNVFQLTPRTGSE